MNTPLEEQISAYVEEVERARPPVSARDALTRVETVRVADRRDVATGPRWRNVAVVAGVAAVSILVVASPFLFGRWTEPSAEPAAEGSSSTVTSTTRTTVPARQFAPGDTVGTETHLGTWRWTNVGLPPVDVPGMVGWYDGAYWALDGSHQPGDSAAIFRSSDSVHWEAFRLPAEMDAHILYLVDNDGRLTLVGYIPTDRFAYKAWVLGDDGSWVEDAGSAPWSPTPMPTDGFTADGFVLRGLATEQATLGDVVVATGIISIELPEDLPQALYESQWAEESSGSGVRYGYGDDGNRYEATIERNGTTLDMTIWDGEEGGDVIHRATLTAPDEAALDAVVGYGPIPTSLPAAWRSDDGGTTFTRIDDPFASLIGGPGFGWTGVQTVLVRDGRIIAYGRVPENPSTPGSDAESVYGAVATTRDGRAWDVTTITELGDPYQVTEFGDQVVWGGSTSMWISDDGVTGEVIDTEANGGRFLSASQTFLIQDSSSGIILSRDGRSWSTVPFPERRSSGYGLGVFGDRVILTQYGSSDAIDTVWVGALDD